MIDDELVIAVRVRISAEVDYRTRANLAGAIADYVVTIINDHPSSLAGVELTFPTFEPYPEAPLADNPTTTSP